MSTSIPKPAAAIRGRAQWEALLAADPTLAAVGGRQLGSAVTDHRSSWVRRLDTKAGRLFIKTYSYSTSGSRLRGLWRHTGPWCRSRAAREFDALEWLRAHDLPAPRPIAALELRRFGFVAQAILVTEAFDGEAADRTLASLAPTERLALGEAIGTFVRACHRLGFRDRNLDLRNLLVRRDPAGWVVAKVDSPRFRLRRPGRPVDALARADWQRLLPQLEQFGVAGAAQRGSDDPREVG